MYLSLVFETAKIFVNYKQVIITTVTITANKCENKDEMKMWLFLLIQLLIHRASDTPKQKEKNICAVFVFVALVF